MNAAAFRDPDLAAKLLTRIRAQASSCGAMRIMEVCGTHTMEIGRLGLRSILPTNIELLSGPGCPVCVTPASVIDASIELAGKLNLTVLTFGDMIRVPGTHASLQAVKASGGAVEVVTSPLQALTFAAENPAREFVFVAVGFETTIPAVASTVLQCRSRGLRNLSFLVAHRLVPPALDALIADRALGLSGFLLPGHVSAIVGEQPYQRLVDAGLPAAITGFEPLDILAGILEVVTMIAAHRVAIVNAYSRVVKPQGNPAAQRLIAQVFEPCDAVFRGIGSIPQSGLRLRPAFADLDARPRHGLRDVAAVETMPAGCSCGEVLRGKIPPPRCPLFGTTCTPESPVGPCMVSSEGSCAAYWRYGEGSRQRSNR